MRAPDQNLDSGGPRIVKLQVKHDVDVTIVRPLSDAFTSSITHDGRFASVIASQIHNCKVEAHELTRVNILLHYRASERQGSSSPPSAASRARKLYAAVSVATHASHSFISLKRGLAHFGIPLANVSNRERHAHVAEHPDVDCVLCNEAVNEVLHNPHFEHSKPQNCTFVPTTMRRSST